MTKVAVIGAGLIGRAWSIVFARAGFEVALWDQFPLQVQAAQDFVADRLPELQAALKESSEKQKSAPSMQGTPGKKSP